MLNMIYDAEIKHSVGTSIVTLVKAAYFYNSQIGN